MGILGKFFGSKNDYPALDSSTPTAKQLESMSPSIKRLGNKTSDPLEVVPAEDSVYILKGVVERTVG